MYSFPFKNQEVAGRLAKGLLKAGLPGKLTDYCRISKENRLNEKEIKELFFGRRIAGAGGGFEIDSNWWEERTEDGRASFHNPWGEDNGTSWVEDDMVCQKWDLWWGGLKYCFDVYRNPAGTREMKNEYIRVSDFAVQTFSPMN